ncbi:hypothetical protein SO802_026344 [Lithocarpus litseifolius]|uniref:Uncharacterized protein n=1 Tax=Lithocarpus litseifolius TaxID=425828 RepID=A0AAW2BZG4_9ROSI
MGKLVMLKMLLDCMLLHLGLGYQMLERILLQKVFALSPTEVGSMISLGPKDSCEFFHDPSMLSSNAGQVRKSLTIKAHADGTGYLISLSCNAKDPFGNGV